MKKHFFILLALFAINSFVRAESVKVLLNNGKEIKGELVMYNETLLILEPNTVVKYEKKLTPKEVDYFEIANVGVFRAKEGMFVLCESKEKQEVPNLAKDSVKDVPNDFWQRVLSEKFYNSKTEPANPNEVIGRALLTTGGVALGIGLPCLIAGVATCIAGNGNNNGSKINDDKTNCQKASYYLLGVGASLTIISIPLIVHGKYIANMKFNYTGTGAGIAVNF